MVKLVKPESVFKCLGDETRLMATLLIFKEGELCVCELMEAMGESQPKISRHLAQLRACGLLTDMRRGQWVFYSISLTLPDWVNTILDSAYSANKSAVSAAQKSLDSGDGRARC
jgi:ArsR family transcriptional regulator